MTILEDFSALNEFENDHIKEWKNAGKKVLGYFCSYLPEEIIYAAEILPIRMRARSCSDTPMADAYLSPTTCSFVRCCLELANRKQYSFLDGIVSCNCCDQIRRLYDNIRYKGPFPFHYIMGIPGVVSGTTIEWFTHELTKFKQTLEKETEISITENMLLESIKEYNKSRDLLKKLYNFRKLKFPPISGTEVNKILTTGVSIPKIRFNELLSKQLVNLKDTDGISDYKSRIMIIGSMLDDPEYLSIIEELGGLIVTDSLCLGTRYFEDSVDINMDPLAALAKRYLSKISCPRMTDGQNSRTNFMKNLIKEYNVDGVIFERIKFCALWWSEIFMLRNKLKEEGIPFLELEREYISSGVGAMKTRVQTFMEILEAR